MRKTCADAAPETRYIPFGFLKTENGYACADTCGDIYGCAEEEEAAADAAEKEAADIPELCTADGFPAVTVSVSYFPSPAYRVSVLPEIRDRLGRAVSAATRGAAVRAGTLCCTAEKTVIPCRYSVLTEAQYMLTGTQAGIMSFPVRFSLRGAPGTGLSDALSAGEKSAAAAAEAAAYAPQAPEFSGTCLSEDGGFMCAWFVSGRSGPQSGPEWEMFFAAANRAVTDAGGIAGGCRCGIPWMIGRLGTERTEKIIGSARQAERV